MASRLILPFADVGNGISPSDGAKLFFFETGTSTNKNTFSDQAGTIANANPVIADSDGLFPDIFLDGTYKVILKDKNDVQQWEADPVVELGISPSITAEDYADMRALDSSSLADGQVIMVTDTSGSAGNFVVTTGTVTQIVGVKEPFTDDANRFAELIDQIKTLVKGTDVASATALVVGDGNYFDVTGTTTITSITTLGIVVATPGILPWIKLHFDGILTLTHNATDLSLPGLANITTAAGDEAEFVEYATGDWRCTVYTKASGETVIGNQIMLVRDEKTSGTDGGASIAGIQIRDLNTVTQNTITGASLASDRITLPTGTYLIEAFAPAFECNTTRLSIFDVDNVVTALVGTSLFADTADGLINARLNEVLVVPSGPSRPFELRHRTETVKASNGLGVPNSDGNVEVYAQIRIEKIG